MDWALIALFCHDFILLSFKEIKAISEAAKKALALLISLKTKFANHFIILQ